MGRLLQIQVSIIIKFVVINIYVEREGKRKIEKEREGVRKRQSERGG